MFVTFLTVLEERSFSRAAERLGYVQSTVTAQIRLLEQACGKKLFDRLPRGVEPTRAGLEAAAYAARFVRLSEGLKEAMASLDEPQGSLHVQALESFSTAHLTPVLEAFVSRYPRIRLELAGGFLQETAEAVAAGRAELGLVPADPGRGELSFEPLLTERLVWVASPQVGRRWRADGWDALSAERVIGFGGRCMYHTLAERLLQQYASAYNVPRRAPAPMVFASPEMIRQAVRCGLGFALLPQTTVHADIAAGVLDELPLNDAISPDSAAPNPGSAAPVFIEPPGASLTALYAGSIATACTEPPDAPSAADPLLLTHGLIRAKHRELSTPARLFREALLEHFDDSYRSAKANIPPVHS
ncbi:LysR family transcriptional regulator [Paenibacillus chartarius]|uniref:LysR family transcriptional regulator n=1 Tax=Paenibacillus chartarius TaxID=747481 RepID=A0ABV6DI52_9BACL